MDVVDLESPTLGPAEIEGLADAERNVRRTLALRAELDEPAAPYNLALDADPAKALFQLAALAPLGPADQQRLLATEDVGRYLALLAELAAEESAVLAHRLAGY